MKGTVGGAALWSLSTNCITYDDLEILVNGGCVFLPAAGFYFTNWGNGGTSASYWAATQNPSNTSFVYYLLIGNSDDIATYLNLKSYYLPVRLVRE